MGTHRDEEKTGPGGSMKANEITWDRLGLYLRDRGEDTFRNHAEVAQEARVSVKWLEARLREESIQGFELDDGSWVTTLRSVWKFLEREPADTPREIVKSQQDLEDLTPSPFRIRPRTSTAGDCMFMYFAVDEAFAERVDDFLTVYRAIAGRRRVVGFKLKNLRLLTARIGDFWVQFQTAEFQVQVLIRRVLQASLDNPTFEDDALPKYHEVLESAGSMTASPIPALV